MRFYEVVMTPDATDDLTGLRDYIAYTLLAPDTALFYIKAIRKEIEALSTMPERYPLIENEPWHSRGIRKLIVKNFYIYYRVDEAAKRVYILNVIYAKRDQLKVLARMKDNLC